MWWLRLHSLRLLPLDNQPPSLTGQVTASYTNGKSLFVLVSTEAQAISTAPNLLDSQSVLWGTRQVQCQVRERFHTQNQQSGDRGFGSLLLHAHFNYSSHSDVDTNKNLLALGSPAGNMLIVKRGREYFPNVLEGRAWRISYCCWELWLNTSACMTALARYQVPKTYVITSA